MSRKRDFLEGSLLEHVASMILTSSVSMVFFYMVDGLAALYISRTAGAEELAALGVAVTAQFALTSISIAVYVSCGTVVSKHLGMRDNERAGSAAYAGIGLVVLTSAVSIVAFLLVAPSAMELLGIPRAVSDIAMRYLLVSAPANILSGLGLLFSNLLRCHALPGIAMRVQMSGPLSAAFLDPVLIVFLGLGLTGASITFVISRLVTSAFGAYYLFFRRRVIRQQFVWSKTFPEMISVAKLTAPILLAGLATPFAMIYVSSAFARFGPDVLAGATINDRIMQLAFAALFVVPGAVGPILGQSFGAKKYERAKKALITSHLFLLLLSTSLATILAISARQISWIFNAGPTAESLVVLFCRVGTFGWALSSVYFVTVSAMNTFGYARHTVALGWFRATFGTALFVHVGFSEGKPELIIYSQLFGSMFMAVLCLALTWLIIRRLDQVNAKQIGDAQSTILQTP